MAFFFERGAYHLFAHRHISIATAMASKNIYKELLQLGGPILVGQLGMIAVGFADNIMVGHYSTAALASASFVNNVFNVAILACVGFTYGITPLVGRLFGAGRIGDIGASVRVGLRINIIYCLIIMAVMTALYFNLGLLGQPEELLPLIRPYYLISLAGLLPITVFNVFAQWSYAVGNSKMPMWIILATNGMNVLGNYALIYGHWGMPELGLTGAGLSTLAARVMAPVVIMAIFFMRRHNEAYARGFRRIGGPYEEPRPSMVWRTSFPVSIQMSLETSAFSGAAVMAGWLGAIDLAAFQIIVIVGTLGFCIYYSLGAAIAAKVAVASGIGADANAHMRHIASAGYRIMLSLMTLSSIVFALWGRDIMSIFSNDPAVVAAAGMLIVPLLLYQLGDATQVTFANALRGTGHVLPMLWIAFFCYLVLGLPSTFLLAFTAGLGLWGIVLSFSISLFSAGVLFLAYFLRATNKSKHSE